MTMRTATTVVALTAFAVKSVMVLSPVLAFHHDNESLNADTVSTIIAAYLPFVLALGWGLYSFSIFSLVVATFMSIVFALGGIEIMGLVLFLLQAALKQYLTYGDLGF